MDWSKIVIGIAGAVLTGVVLYFVKKLEEKLTWTERRNRFRKLNNVFQGSVQQVIKGVMCTAACKLVLKTQRRGKLKGTLEVLYDDQGEYPHSLQEMKVTGNYHYDFLLTLTYENSKESSHQAGVIILHFAPTGDALKGEFMGYGPITTNIDDCRGKVSLKRVIKD